MALNNPPFSSLVTLPVQDSIVFIYIIRNRFIKYGDRFTYYCQNLSQQRSLSEGNEALKST